MILVERKIFKKKTSPYRRDVFSHCHIGIKFVHVEIVGPIHTHSHTHTHTRTHAHTHTHTHTHTADKYLHIYLHVYAPCHITVTEGLREGEREGGRESGRKGGRQVMWTGHSFGLWSGDSHGHSIFL